MIHAVGFDTIPKAVVLWLEDGEKRYKTVCYSNYDVEQAIIRSHVEGDFFYNKDFIIVYSEE